VVAEQGKERVMAKVLVHNPQAPEPQTDTSLAELKWLPESRAGIFPNRKQNAELVMTQIVEELGRQYGVIKAMVGERPTGTRPDPAMVDELVEKCDWVIVGSGD
jgi:hypothetical protein